MTYNWLCHYISYKLHSGYTVDGSTGSSRLKVIRSGTNLFEILRIKGLTLLSSL
jgi:hypothetical protein